MGLGFFSHVKDGFAHILTDKGNLVKVSASRMAAHKPGGDVKIRQSKQGFIHVGATVADADGKKPKSTKLNTAHDRQQYAMKRLMSPGHGPEGKGWSAAQASGVVGRFMVEAFDHLDTNAKNPNDPGTSEGLGQWNRERKDNLKAFAKKRGTTISNFDVNLDFFDHEIMNDPREHVARSALMAAKSPDQAATAMLHYERPAGYTPGNPRGGALYGKTVKNAQRLMASYDPKYVPDVDVGGGAVGSDDNTMMAGDPSLSEDPEDPRAFDFSGGSDVASDDIQDEPTLGETMGDQFATDMSGSGESGADLSGISQNIAGMIEQGQQASAGALPRLPSIEELFSQG